MERKLLLFVSLLLMVFLLVACQGTKTSCPQVEGVPEPTLSFSDLVKMTPVPAAGSGTLEVEIKGKMTTVDKVVDYPLCNDNWTGTVYVTCDVQVLPWVETPTFFKDCDLSIEPGTVVYVAYHNDTAYYKGCSCHTGEISDP